MAGWGRGWGWGGSAFSWALTSSKPQSVSWESVFPCWLETLSREGLNLTFLELALLWIDQLPHIECIGKVVSAVLQSLCSRAWGILLCFQFLLFFKFFCFCKWLYTWDFFFQILNLLFYTGVLLIDSVVIVSGEQQRDSVVRIHVSILPQTLLSSRLAHHTEQSSLCYTIRICWLSILNRAVCMWPSQSP